MNAPGLGPLLILLLAGSGWGCAVMDRESYSLVIRKKAHQYEPAPAPEVIPDDAPAADLDLPDPGTFVRHDLDDLIRNLGEDRQAFRPFAYCRLHDSSHGFESVVACVVAPVEYSVALTTNFTYLTAETALKYLMYPLEMLLPPPEKPLTLEERKRPSTK